MPKLSWPEIVAIHARAHLVVVTFPGMEQLGTDLRNAQATLKRFLHLRMRGAALGSIIVRTGGDPEIHLAFAVETDARRFADELGAGVTDRYPGWASQRSGNVTARKLGEIRASLAPAKPLLP